MGLRRGQGRVVGGVPEGPLRAGRRPPRPASPPPSPRAGTPRPATTAHPAAVSASATGQVGARMVLNAYVDVAKVASAVTPISAKLGKPARDARFQVSGKTARVVPGQVGVGVDVPALAASLDATLKGTGRRSVTVTLGEAQPRLTTEAAQAMGIKERISTFTTQYAATSNTPRVNNIHTLARGARRQARRARRRCSASTAPSASGPPRRATRRRPPSSTASSCRSWAAASARSGTTIFNAVFFSGCPVRRAHEPLASTSATTRRAATRPSRGAVPTSSSRTTRQDWILDPHRLRRSARSPISAVRHRSRLQGRRTRRDRSRTSTPYHGREVKDPTLPARQDGRRRTRAWTGVSVVVVRTVTQERRGRAQGHVHVGLQAARTRSCSVGTMAPSKPATATPTPTATGTATEHWSRARGRGEGMACSSPNSRRCRAHELEELQLDAAARHAAQRVYDERAARTGASSTRRASTRVTSTRSTTSRACRSRSRTTCARRTRTACSPFRCATSCAFTPRRARPGRSPSSATRAATSSAGRDLMARTYRVRPARRRTTSCRSRTATGCSPAASARTTAPSGSAR